MKEFINNLFWGIVYATGVVIAVFIIIVVAYIAFTWELPPIKIDVQDLKILTGVIFVLGLAIAIAES